MAVVVNEFEASVDPGAARSETPRGPSEIKPHELRRHLRRLTLRAERVRAG
jgi:hypothetical protein